MISIHETFEMLLPSWSKNHLFDDLVWDNSEIEENDYHIGLFTSDAYVCLRHFTVVVKFFGGSIFNEFLSFSDESTNVVETVLVLDVGEHSVPWSSLACFLWLGGFVQQFDSVWVIDQESEVFLHVLFFNNNFIGLTKLDTVEEVWKVLIDFNFLGLE